MNDRKAGRAEVASVRKALDLLEAFSFENPAWTLSDLARRLQIPKSTAHNLLRTMQSFDMVRQDAESHNYRLGARVMELGLLFARSTEMLTYARPLLRSLAEETGETVKLAMLSSDQVLVVAAIESAQNLHTRGDIGKRWPLHSSSLGKAILGALPAEEAREILERQSMPRFTEATVTTWPAMQEELRRLSRRGYALDLEESEPGVHCMAVPLTGAITGEVAALSVSAPSIRMDQRRMGQIGRLLLAAARRIGARVGSRKA